MLLRQEFKKYLSNTSWLISEKVFNILISFVVGVYVIRYLGPENYGILSYAISFAGLFSALAALGLDRIIVCDLVEEPFQHNELLGTAFVMRIIGALGVYAMIIMAIPFTSNSASTNILIFIIASGLIFQSFKVIDFWYQAKVLSKYVVISQFTTVIISSALKLLFILTGMSVIYFALVAMLESVVLMICLAGFYFRHKGSLLAWKFKPELAKSLINRSWPVIISGIVGSFYMRIDQVMIKEIMGSRTVGEYAAAAKLAEAWYFIPMVVSSSLAPAITKARSTSYKLYTSHLVKIYGLLIWIAIIIALFTTIIADHLVIFIFGPEYINSSGILCIYIWAGVFVSGGVAKGTWTILESQQKYTMINQTIGTTLNIILNLILIPRYGGYGAALATLATVISNNMIVPLLLNKAQRDHTFLFFKSFNPLYIISGSYGIR
jgi:O-antigen/teichoic acid export membrane protein